MAKYKRKTVRRYTVKVPSLDKEGLPTTESVRIPMPTKGVTLSHDHKKEVVEAFVSIYLMDGESMDSAASKMNSQRSWSKTRPVSSTVHNHGSKPQWFVVRFSRFPLREATC